MSVHTTSAATTQVVDFYVTAHKRHAMLGIDKNLSRKVTLAAARELDLPFFVDVDTVKANTSPVVSQDLDKKHHNRWMYRSWPDRYMPVRIYAATVREIEMEYPELAKFWIWIDKLLILSCRHLGSYKVGRGDTDALAERLSVLFGIDQPWGYYEAIIAELDDMKPHFRDATFFPHMMETLNLTFNEGKATLFILDAFGISQSLLQILTYRNSSTTRIVLDVENKTTFGVTPRHYCVWTMFISTLCANHQQGMGNKTFTPLHLVSFDSPPDAEPSTQTQSELGEDDNSAPCREPSVLTAQASATLEPPVSDDDIPLTVLAKVAAITAAEDAAPDLETTPPSPPPPPSTPPAPDAAPIESAQPRSEEVNSSNMAPAESTTPTPEKPRQIRRQISPSARLSLEAAQSEARPRATYVFETSNGVRHTSNPASVKSSLVKALEVDSKWKVSVAYALESIEKRLDDGGGVQGRGFSHLHKRMSELVKRSEKDRATIERLNSDLTRLKGQVGEYQTLARRFKNQAITNKAFIDTLGNHNIKRQHEMQEFRDAIERLERASSELAQSRAKKEKKKKKRKRKRADTPHFDMKTMADIIAKQVTAAVESKMTEVEQSSKRHKNLDQEYSSSTDVHSSEDSDSDD